LTDIRTNAQLTEATASGLRWVTLARVGTEILLLASMVWLARLIPPAAFGMFALALIVQELAVNVPSEAVGSALVQRRSIEREHLQGGLALSLALGGALAAVSLVLSLVVVRPLFGSDTMTLFMLTMPWFLLGAVLVVPLAVLRRRLDFRRLSLIDLTQSTVRSGSSIVLAAGFGLDASALVLGGLIGTAAMLVLALAFVRLPLPRWRPAAMRELLPYGGPAALASICWTGFRNADYAIVGARLGAAQAGFYWRGFQLAVEYQRKVTVVMTQMGFPVFARSESVDEMFVLRRRMVRLLTVVLFPVLVVLVLLAPVVIPWLFGPQWKPAVVPTQILTATGATTVIIDQVGAVLMATGRSRAMLGYGLAHFVVYAGAVLFAAGHGLAAVSAATVVVHTIFLVIAYHMMLRGRPERTLPFLWGDVAAATVSCVVLAVAAWPVEAALDAAGAPAPVHIVLVGAVAAIAYLAALRLLFADAWRDLFSLLRRMLPLRPLRAAARRVPLFAGRSS
jgi:PST family polysaccharide transporter